MRSFTLRDYQLAANAAIWKSFNSGQRRVLVVLASGLGKTVLAGNVTCEWLSRYRGRVLFVAHTIEILQQTRTNFKLMLNENVSTGITTSVESENANAQVRFVTFQSLANELPLTDPNEFGLIIIDEAHHGQAVTYRETIEFFHPELLLGMTATPERMDGKDIREIFGDEVYNYSLARALADDKWLARLEYRLLTDNISISVLRQLIRDVGDGDRTVSRRQIDDTIFLDERLEEIARITKEEQGSKLKTLIFCRSVQHLEIVAEYFSKAGRLHCYLPKKQQQECIADFRSGRIQTILVVDKFNEGVDVPDAELIVFLRSTDSKTIWLQQLGRGLRRTTGKTRVQVLDFVANCTRIEAVTELQLKITEHTGTNPNDPIRISGCFDVRFATEIVDVLKLLERLKGDFYPTWEEAAQATRQLSIKSALEYPHRYRSDPRLPSCPHVKYADVWKTNGGWPGFTGVDSRRSAVICYPTWEEAAQATRQHGIKSVSEYDSRYRSDPRLPCNPNRMYADVWKTNGGWQGFTGVDSLRLAAYCYPTWEEAAQATRQLGIKSELEYRRRYRSDPRLPSNPEVKYADVWDANGGMPGFAGLDFQRRKIRCYPTWEEAAQATRQLGIKLSVEYKRRYRSDPRLPSNPNVTYADVWKTNGGWPGFLGTRPDYHKD